jgi:hypothetical protein
MHKELLHILIFVTPKNVLEIMFTDNQLEQVWKSYAPFNGFLTVHHSVELKFTTNLMHNFLFIQ